MLRKYIFIIISLVFLTTGSICSAQLTNLSDMYTNTKNFAESSKYQEADVTSLPIMIAKAIRVFLGVLGVVFIILIISAGWSWFSAGGDPSKVKKAKELLINSTIGLIIIFSAYSITYFIFSSADSLNGAGGGGPASNSATVT